MGPSNVVVSLGYVMDQDHWFDAQCGEPLAEARPKKLSRLCGYWRRGWVAAFVGAVFALGLVGVDLLAFCFAHASSCSVKILKG